MYWLLSKSEQHAGKSRHPHELHYKTSNYVKIYQELMTLIGVHI